MATKTESAINPILLAGAGVAVVIGADQLPENARKPAQYVGIGLLCIGGFLIIKNGLSFGLDELLPKKAGPVDDYTIPDTVETIDADSTTPEIDKAEKQIGGDIPTNVNGGAGGIGIGGIALTGNFVSPVDSGEAKRALFSDAYPVTIEIQNNSSEHRSAFIEIEATHNRKFAGDTKQIDSWGSYELAAGEVRRIDGMCSTGDLNTGLFEFGFSYASLLLKINGVIVHHIAEVHIL